MQTVYDPGTYHRFGEIMGDLGNLEASAFIFLLMALFVIAVISAIETYDRMVYRTEPLPSFISVVAFSTLCSLSAIFGVALFMAGVRYIPQLVLSI